MSKNNGRAEIDVISEKRGHELTPDNAQRIIRAGPGAGPRILIERLPSIHLLETVPQRLSILEHPRAGHLDVTRRWKANAFGGGRHLEIRPVLVGLAELIRRAKVPV
jgi:hypothetical protein